MCVWRVGVCDQLPARGLLFAGGDRQEVVANTLTWGLPDHRAQFPGTSLDGTPAKQFGDHGSSFRDGSGPVGWSSFFGSQICRPGLPRERLSACRFPRPKGIHHWSDPPADVRVRRSVDNPGIIEGTGRNGIERRPGLGAGLTGTPWLCSDRSCRSFDRASTEVLTPPGRTIRLPALPTEATGPQNGTGSCKSLQGVTASELGGKTRTGRPRDGTPGILPASLLTSVVAFVGGRQRRAGQEMEALAPAGRRRSWPSITVSLSVR